MSTTATSTDAEHQALVFGLDDQEYCISIEFIAEIVDRPDKVTTLPNTPEHVRGLVDLRGRTTTVLDPKSYIGQSGATSQRRIIVFSNDDESEQRSVGWLVDDVDRVIGFDPDDVDDGVANELTLGVIKADGQFVLWVRPDAIES